MNLKVVEKEGAEEGAGGIVYNPHTVLITLFQKNEKCKSSLQNFSLRRKVLNVLSAAINPPRILIVMCGN